MKMNADDESEEEDTHITSHINKEETIYTDINTTQKNDACTTNKERDTHRKQRQINT